MKCMIASDIHGSAYYCEKMLECFEFEGADRLLLLGDLLYHGPRNDLPKDYNPKKVIKMLNDYKDKLLCVRGNCDTEVDQMVLEFPIMADYCILTIGSHIIYATHGHHFHEDNPPALQKDDILLCGHTHIPKYKEHTSYIYMNPGSISIPKENSHNGYMIMENSVFEWKDLNSKLIQRIHIS